MRVTIERYGNEPHYKYWFSCFRKFNGKEELVTMIGVGEEDYWKGWFHLIKPTSWITKFTLHQ